VKELRPLKDSSRSLLSRALLGAARRDGLPAEARARALKALGIGAGVAVAGGVGHAAASLASQGGGATAGAAATTTATTAKLTSLVLLKWIGACALGASAVVSIGYVARPPKPSVSEPARSIPERGTSPATGGVAAETRDLNPSPNAVDVPPEKVQGSSPVLSRPPPAASSADPRAGVYAPPPSLVEISSTTPPVTEGRPSAIAAELDALNTVRAALAAKDAERALRLLDEFEAKTPVSPLREEAAVLRVESLLLAGRLTEARSAAEAFVARYPKSPYLERVRRAMGDTAR
jgi:hypothetical protein